MNRRSFFSRAAAFLGGALVAPFVKPVRRWIRPSEVEFEYKREVEVVWDYSDEFNSEPECDRGPPWDVNCRCDPCVEHYRIPEGIQHWNVHENPDGSRLYIPADVEAGIREEFGL